MESPSFAESLGISEGAARHRLIRYARKGWLERRAVVGGGAYRLTPRGQARLTWLDSLAESEQGQETPFLIDLPASLGGR